MKKFFLWFSAIIIVLIIAISILISRIDTQFVIDKIAESTTKATGHPLIFEDKPSLSFIPLGAKFGKVTFGDEKLENGVFIKANGGLAEIELTPLFSGNIVVSQIYLDSPYVEFKEKNDDSAPKLNNVDEKSKKASPMAPSDSFPIELGKFNIKNGHVHYVAKDGLEATISNLDINVTNLRRREEAAVECSCKVIFKENAKESDIATNLVFNGKIRYYAPNLTFRETNLGIKPISGLIKESMGPIKLSLEGAYNLQNNNLRLVMFELVMPYTTIKLNNGEAGINPYSFKANLDILTQPRHLLSLVDIKLKENVKDKFSLKTNIEFSNNNLSFKQITGVLDDTPLGGDLNIYLAKPMSISGGVQVGNVNLDNYLPLSSTSSSSNNKNSQNADKNNQALSTKDNDESQYPIVNIRAALSSIKYGRIGIKDIGLIIKGAKGKYDVSSLAFALVSGGNFKGSANSDIIKMNHGIKMNGSGINVAGILEMIGKPRMLEGMASLNIDLSVHGKDIIALQQSLNGKGTIEIQNMFVPAIAKLPKIAGQSVPDRFDSFKALFAAKNGNVNVNPINVVSKTLMANGHADISLPNSRLDAKVDVKTLGMTIPVVAHGPFNNLTYGLDPKFSLDMAKSVGNVIIGGGKDTGNKILDGGKNAGDKLKKGIDGIKNLFEKKD